MTEFQFKMFIVMNRYFGKSYIKNITTHISINDILILKVKSNFEHVCKLMVLIINQRI